MSVPFEQQLTNVPEIPANLNLLRRVMDNGLHIVDVQFYPEAALILRGSDDDDESNDSEIFSDARQVEPADTVRSEAGPETTAGQNLASEDADPVDVTTNTDPQHGTTDQHQIPNLSARQLRALFQLTESAARDLPPLAMSRRRLSGPAQLQSGA